MSDIFHSSKYMIERAKTHFTDFKSQLAEFMKTKPYASVVDIDTNTSQKIHKIKLVKPVPVNLPGIASDIVVNLRSALDQAVFAITNTLGVKPTYFPFAKDAAHFQNMVNGRCKDLPQSITDLICSFKPYKGGSNLLWALNELSNANKHAVIRPIAIATGTKVVNMITCDDGNSVYTGFSYWDRTKNEMEIFRQSIDGNAKFNIQVSAYIAIGDVEFVDGVHAQQILEIFINMVENIVSDIEAEARQLGLC